MIMIIVKSLLSDEFQIGKVQFSRCTQQKTKIYIAAGRR